MAENNPSSVYRIMMYAGLADIGLGVLVAVLAFTGMVGGDDPTLLAAIGGLFAVIGVGIFIWARNKLSQADERRGDLN